MLLSGEETSERVADEGGVYLRFEGAASLRTVAVVEVRAALRAGLAVEVMRERVEEAVARLAGMCL